MIFEAAKDALKAMLGDKKLPKIGDLEREQKYLISEQSRLYNERAKLKNKIRQADIAKNNIDRILNISVINNEKTTAL